MISLALPRPTQYQLLLFGVLWLCATGRWGSYVGGWVVPFYIGDLVLAAGLVQTALAVPRSGLDLRDVRSAFAQAPLALLLTAALLGWSVVRLMLGVSDLASQPLVALRDFAPYGYAVVALLSFVLVSADGPRQRIWVYGALCFHLVWVSGAPHLQDAPWSGLMLGGAPIFTLRPDFDSAILGLAVGLALHDLLKRGRSTRRWEIAALVLFGFANGYQLLALVTRAGLLAGLVAVGAVLLSWFMRGSTWRDLWGRRGIALVVGVMALLIMTLASPPGQRILQAVRGEQGNALGTLQAREAAWSGVSDFVTSDATRTAVGVGFGDDFLTDSGTVYALEGDSYTGVRSPHNYVIGTLARLGLAGALLAGLVLAASARLAVLTLARPTGAVTALAALLVLTLPVTALLGVVLESPFGAIPYFWAVGHLARCSIQQRRGRPAVVPAQAAEPAACSRYQA